MSLKGYYDDVPPQISRDLGIIVRYLIKKNGGSMILPSIEEMEYFEGLGKKDAIDKYIIRENGIITGIRLEIVKIA